MNNSDLKVLEVIENTLQDNSEKHLTKADFSDIEEDKLVESLHKLRTMGKIEFEENQGEIDFESIKL
ncbi:hypothetical protein [Facklamia miroungae]|uniref:Uncharacterized protein n=1 Tax=Facklamia miroungae TaxID=120956 RepID=A0A1G7RXE3_9LACT|nr:hypothetical protein [Facklamia miroungae]NKZ29240.1 hypothetical protein [Facklamia miroungae]SDG15438.1 hypothetical protein SAMN05421791_103215 [Facklamia miroungae]